MATVSVHTAEADVADESDIVDHRLSHFHRDGAGHGRCGRPVSMEDEAPGKTAIDQNQMPRPGASLCCLTLPRFRCPPAA